MGNKDLERQVGASVEHVEDARRLVRDPEHLRRKAAWIRARAAETSSADLQYRRLKRAWTLEADAAAIEAERQEVEGEVDVVFGC